MSLFLEMKTADMIDIIRRGKAVIAVYGLGRMGLATACLFAEAGAKVIGVDTDSRVVELINSGKSPVAEPNLETLIKKHIGTGRFSATGNGKETATKATVIIIVVPTQLDRRNHPDYSAVEKACNEIGRGLNPGCLIIFESTVSPGTTETLVKETIEKNSGFKAGLNFGLVYSPIRATAGQVIQDIVNYPRVIAATDPRSLEAACAVLGIIIKGGFIRVRNFKTAETTKLCENIYRDINIALSNELAMFCERLGVDFDEVRAAANTQPHCHLHIPGAWVGGHCLPGDEYIFINRGDGLEPIQLEKLFRELDHDSSLHRENIGEDERVYPTNLMVLSYNMARNQAEFRRVLWFSRRRYQGKILELSTTMGQKLKVTEDHPMIVYQGGAMNLVSAKALKHNDSVPLITELPSALIQRRRLDPINENIIETRTQSFRLRKNSAVATINSIKQEVVSNRCVYNLEVCGGSHTFVTTGGLIVHNCIPQNPLFLIETAEDLGIPLRIPPLARKINDQMPSHTIRLAIDALRVCKKNIKRAKVAVLGVSYRANVKEIRFSPVKDVIEMLQKRGAKVIVFDPYFTAEELKKLGYVSARTAERAVDGVDCILVTVGHDEFKRLKLDSLVRFVRKPAALIDAGHIFNPTAAEEAGFIYRGIGRGIWTK
ncbi:nucleotide sugar dehydrogenase [Candidatus Bathyarchaeota archaeon]|nr:nucleotide sugar dehydrogenase [Candidatus Bathyarchaeota archaeon]